MTRSTQCNVTWQTSSEYCCLAKPSSRVLNYFLFAWEIQILEIFGSPVIGSWHQTFVAYTCKEGICNSYTAVSGFDNHSFNLYPYINDSDSGMLQ